MIDAMIISFRVDANIYLTFNKGVDPNMWSIFEGTSRGVTLHHMDAELDKGLIIDYRLAII